MNTAATAKKKMANEKNPADTAKHPIAQRRAISALLIVSLYPSPSHAASSL
jgi:hypothetical protein